MGVVTEFSVQEPARRDRRLRYAGSELSSAAAHYLRSMTWQSLQPLSNNNRSASMTCWSIHSCRVCGVGVSLVILDKWPRKILSGAIASDSARRMRRKILAIFLNQKSLDNFRLVMRRGLIEAPIKLQIFQVTTGALIDVKNRQHVVAGPRVLQVGARVVGNSASDFAEADARRLMNKASYRPSL